LVRESVGVLMEGTPEGIHVTEIESSLNAIPHVVAVHDLHVWSLSLGKPSLSVHLLVDQDTNRRPALVAASKMLARQFRIHHSTIQVEEADDNIHCNPSSAVASGTLTPTNPSAPLMSLPIASGTETTTGTTIGAKKEYGTF
jgi:zinc transporter 2